MLQRLQATSLGVVLYVLSASASHAMLVSFTFDVELDEGPDAGLTFSGKFTLDEFTGSGVEVFRPEGADEEATGIVTEFEVLVFSHDTFRSPNYPLISAVDGEIIVIDFYGDVFGEEDTICKLGCIEIDFSPTRNFVFVDLVREYGGPGGQGKITDIAVVPIPPALYLFGSGLIGLVGIARRKKAA